MKIIIFGVGNIYEENRKRISAEDEIVAFFDNNTQIQGDMLDGVSILAPRAFPEIAFDKIIIMSVRYAEDMKKQLLELGCPEDALLHYYEYFAEKSLTVVSWVLTEEEKQKSCLFITSDADYHGGAMVVVYAVQELMRRGYRAVILAADGNDAFVWEFYKRGIEIRIDHALPYRKWEQFRWVMDFQKIVVNTYPMVLCALEISRHRPVSLWLHESDIVYPIMRYWEERIKRECVNHNLGIYAVSTDAKQNFIRNIMPCEIGILHYGLPDVNGGQSFSGSAGRLNFSVIGTMHPIKQQLFFLQTVLQMDKKKTEQMNIFIIGKADHREYFRKVCSMAEQMERVNLVGELNRQEMDLAYRNIDVVVVPSVYETMSIVATEAMMRGKICIVSDSAGIAGYITSGENGFVFRNEDAEDLAEKISWCIEHRDELPRIGRNARRVYENYFSMEEFGDRLEQLK